MNVLTGILILSATAVVVTTPRTVQVALACESGCVTSDSLQVADAIRAGLARHGVTVMMQGNGRELPLVVTGRISVQRDTVRVAAEFLELEHEIARYTVRTARTGLTASVRQMGERFGRSLIRP